MVKLLVQWSAPLATRTNFSMQISSDDLKTTLQNAATVVKLSAYLTPQNLHEEREKFFQSSDSNPQLIYKDIPREEIQKELSELRTITFSPNNLEDTILHNRLQEMILECELLLHRDTEKITEVSTELFQGSFSEKFQSLAVIDAKFPQPFGAIETLTGEETVVKVREYLATEYGQNDWDISASDQGDFYVRVKAPQKKILINTRINWDFTDMDGVLAHEIDGHILRYMNSQHQSQSFLQTALPFYIKTEEGVASFLVDYCSKNGKLTLKHHALKYLAGIHAKTHSFREVFNFLVESGFTESLAFQRTFRLKRGLSDTSGAGCFAKEALYYEGLIEVKEYIDSGKDLKKLFAGKFGLNDLDSLPEPTQVLLPKRFSSYTTTSYP